ncbi:MAG: hypothetical protein ABIG63_12100 [Chloroflexota bacterium]
MDFETEQMIRYYAPFSAVVDIDGTFNPKTGRFWQVQDAINAGHNEIFIRSGTYAAFSLTSGRIYHIRGCGADTIIDGGIASHAIAVPTNLSLVENLAAKTTSGGGQAYDCIYDSGGINTYRRIRVNSSDRHAFNMAGSLSLIDDCKLYGGTGIDQAAIYATAQVSVSNVYIGSCGANGIDLQGTADNSVITGTFVNSITGTGILIDADAENCVVVGNRVTGCSVANITDNSGTSTVTGNDDT